MLTIKAQLTLKNAKDYFKEHLKVGDYYSEQSYIVGEWLGIGSDLLHLKGPVYEAAFINLVDGLHPHTGDKLTQRLNTTREENGTQKANRRFFYDFCFAPPKSVSVLGLLKDHKVVDLHNECVREAVNLLENYAATRVRKSGQYGNRMTGNLTCALFTHDTSRLLDPQLHTHCVVMNSTHDATENKWKALENSFMLKAQRYIQALYQNRLISGLNNMGYDIEFHERNYEIKHMPSQILQKFSKRLEQIESIYETEKLLSENQHLSPEALKSRIAVHYRNRKMKNQDPEQLQAQWWGELNLYEKANLEALQPTFLLSKPKDLTLEAAFDRADEVLFERNTLTTKETLLATVLEVSKGNSVNLETLEQMYQSRPYLKGPKNDKITLKSALECEKSIIDRVAYKKGVFDPFLSVFEKSDRNLTVEQAAAIEGILQSRDFAVFFKGSAGTGKSFTLKVLAEQLQQAGHTVAVFAPQRQQVLDLAQEGLEAQTVAQLLLKQETSPQSVWIIDEAGQIGARQMNQLMSLAEQHGNRIIFSGDTKQHGAVTASDALIALEKHASIATYELKQIRRQSPRHAETAAERRGIRRYRQAVKNASKGRSRSSMEVLDQLGWVYEHPKAQALEAIAVDFAQSVQRGQTCLIVSQTHEAVRALNASVKQHLKQEAQLGAEHVVETFRVNDKTIGERKDSAYYPLGTYLHFHRAYGSLEKGSVLPVVDKNETHVFVEQGKKRTQVSLKYAAYFSPCTAQKSSLAEGEQLQIKFNGVSQEGKKINNGELVTFLGLTDAGDLKVQDSIGFEKTIAKQQAIVNPGYALTSYAAQGKTVDAVLVYDSQNAAAVNKKEWYVSISRARKRVRIYTPDKERLKQTILASGDRGLAIDLAQVIERDERNRHKAREAAKDQGIGID
jgi:conjugative relaxase-like TrwC/TraI family protein